MSDSSDQPKSAERVFLHDLSNQLVVAQGMGGYVLGRLKKKDDVDPKELTRMEKHHEQASSRARLDRD